MAASVPVEATEGGGSPVLRPPVPVLMIIPKPFVNP